MKNLKTRKIIKGIKNQANINNTEVKVNHQANINNKEIKVNHSFNTKNLILTNKIITNHKTTNILNLILLEKINNSFTEIEKGIKLLIKNSKRRRLFIDKLMA